MNEQEKREQQREYEAAKQQGEPFYPNAFARDALVALLILLVLIGLSAFFPAELQPPANPADASYIPRPEWYFLFLYELLKFLPGILAVVGIIVLPAAVFLVLFLLPWLDRSKERHPRKRPGVMALLAFTWTVIVGFTALAFVDEPTQADTSPAVAGLNQQQASAGQALFLSTCSGCHGQFGEGGPNPNRQGSIIPPISSHAFLMTFTDDTLYNIVYNGLPDSGMSAFGQQKGGPLDDSKVNLLVTYIRSWETNPPVAASPVPESTGAAASVSAAQGNAAKGAINFTIFGCTSCHAQDGSIPMGADRVVIINPVWLATKTDAQLAAIIGQGFTKPAFMPPYHTRISQPQMDDLLAWLRSHQKK
jgi:mono/diheme cytochrome c family protein